VDELALRAVLGPRLVERGLEWLTEQAEAADAEDAEAIWRRARDSAGRWRCPTAPVCSPRATTRAARVRQGGGDQRLHGRVLPQADGPGLSADRAACRGGRGRRLRRDVNSAVASAALSWFTGGPVHNTDLLADDPEGNTVVFSHCGSGALCLASCQPDIILASCRLMDTGVTVAVSGAPRSRHRVNLVGPRATIALGCSGRSSDDRPGSSSNPVRCDWMSRSVISSTRWPRRGWSPTG